MKLSVQYQLNHAYDEPVFTGMQRLRLTPQSNAMQKVDTWQIALEGSKREVEYTDAFGNLTSLIKLDPSTQNARVMVQGVVETYDKAGILGADQKALPHWIYKAETPRTHAGKSLKKFAQAHKNNDGSAAFFHGLMNQIRESVVYEIGATDVTTTAEEAWAQEKGVCQDHSHIMIAVARHLGFQARYVSGFLLMEDRVDQEATHAWCEINLEGLGWVGFDVSNGYSPDERYVRLAVGRDYFDAAPSHGIRYGSAKEALEVHLQIQQ